MFFCFTSPTRGLKTHLCLLEVGGINVLTPSHYDCLETMKFQYILCFIIVSRRHSFLAPLWCRYVSSGFAWSWSGFSKDRSSPNGAVLVELGPADVDGNQLRSETVLDDTECGATVELAVLCCWGRSLFICELKHEKSSFSRRADHSFKNCFSGNLQGHSRHKPLVTLIALAWHCLYADKQWIIMYILCEHVDCKWQMWQWKMCMHMVHKVCQGAICQWLQWLVCCPAFPD